MGIRTPVIPIVLAQTAHTTYPRIVVDRKEQCLPGLIRTYVDKGGHSYSHEDAVYTLTDKQKEALVPVVFDTVTVQGFSAMDLVKKRDIGNGGFFQYINTTREECESIVQDLVDKKVLVQMTYEKIHDLIRNIKYYEDYPFLSEEPRYKTANQALSNYIADWNLQYFISKRIEITWMIEPTRLRKETDLLQYYIGFKITNNFRTRQKLLHQKMSMVENNDRKQEPDKKLLKAYMEERSVWDKNIRIKLKEIGEKQEYAIIRDKYPALHELFTKPLKRISRILRLNEQDLDW